MIAEQDFTRYTPWLERLPGTTIFNVEEGDPKHFKETVGKNHVIGGFFDPTITLVRSREQCLDEAKRIVDICAPGGKFYFAFNKFVMDIKNVHVSKLAAVLDWVAANTDYLQPAPHWKRTGARRMAGPCRLFRAVHSAILRVRDTHFKRC